MKTQTTDATAKVIGTIKLPTSSAGVLKVSVVGFDGTDAVTGAKIVRFKKVSGTLTLGTASNDLAVEADAGFSGATFAFAANSNNVDISVTGTAGKTINWTANASIVVS
jgi:hypothetical protein